MFLILSWKVSRLQKIVYKPITMEKHRITKRLIALILTILLLPMQAILEEGASASFLWLQKTYEAGQSLFTLGDVTSVFYKMEIQQI